MNREASPPMGQKARLIAAFGAIYLIWGSTYLAIRIGLEGIPPFLLAGSRFLLAGGLLYGWLRLRGLARPTDRQWWAAVVTGVLMLVCGVGGVTWAEQWVPSGAAALLVATVPLWMTVVDGVLLGRSRLGWPCAVGLVIGLAGVGVLVGLSPVEVGRVDPVGAAAILVGAVCWSVGSLHSRRADLPASPAMTVAIQMVSAGFVLLAISSVLREWQDGFTLSDVTARSGLALGYLVVLGSMLALCCYVWLLRRVSAPAVATYAFINPLVAMALGTAAAGEAFGLRELGATVLIVSSVVLIQSRYWRRVPVAEPVGQEQADHRPATDSLPVTAPAVSRPVELPWPRAGSEEPAAARGCQSHVPIGCLASSASDVAPRELA